jgi:hypothetical protein
MFSWLLGSKRKQQPPVEFPFPLQAVRGRDALKTFEALKARGAGTPLILGDRQSVEGLVRQHSETTDAACAMRQSLALAADYRFPDQFRAEVAEARAEFEEEGAYQPELGTWPRVRLPSTWQNGPLLARHPNLQTDHMTAYVTTLPCADAPDAFALLNFGDWNDCPSPHVHVAALRSWGKRYGAELVGLGFDTLHIRVKRRPATRKEALDLAREHYDYCPDTVDQGVETLSNLAADLMQEDWWQFWWD